MLALVYLEENKLPKVYLIPSKEWKNTDDLLRDRNYEGLKSEPEWGLNVSKKNFELLSKYELEKTLVELKEV